MSYQISVIVLSNALTFSGGSKITPELHKMATLSIGATTPTVVVDSATFEKGLAQLLAVQNPIAQKVAAQLAAVR